MDSIPCYVGGIDIETKGVESDAFILSIGAAMFETRSLRLLDRIEYIMAPDDMAQKSRTSSPGTLKWWGMAGRGNSYPSLEARDVCWSGRDTLPHALDMLDEFLASFTTDRGGPIITMKGPDFDYNILRHAYCENGWKRTALRPSLLDSARTTERLRIAAGIPKLDISHLADRLPRGKIIEHTAVCDAAIEGYENAFMYRLMQRVGKEIAL